jgi:Na+/H+ antiporter NhaD/arsenite permease-like protein
MKTGKQKITLFLKVLMVFLILIVVSFFVFRNSILQQAIEKASTKIEQKYNSDLSIRKATLTVSRVLD